MDTLPIGTEVDSLGQLIMGGFASSDSDESRASRVSNVERRIVKKQTICERCRLNEDPNNVPVHPHCDCDVVTDSLESGVADPESRFFYEIDI